MMGTVDWIVAWLLVFALIYIAFGRVFIAIFGMLSELYRHLFYRE